MKEGEREGLGGGEGEENQKAPPATSTASAATNSPPPPPKSRHALSKPESEVNNGHHNSTRTWGWGGKEPRNPHETDKEFPEMKGGVGASSGVAQAFCSVPGQARGRLLLLLL